jgi:hypothetical protein
MENKVELLNKKHLKELIEIADDQDESELIGKMFAQLANSKDQFLMNCKDLLSDDEKLKFESHKLKNLFANFGCTAVSQLLENIYQKARRHELKEIPFLLNEFKILSEITFFELRQELAK